MSTKIYVKYVKNSRDFHTTKLNLPTGNLDHQNGLEVMSLLKNAVEQFSLTLIVVTHDPGIASMADRVITLSDGVIISDAKVKHALSSEIVRNETEGMSQTAPDQEEV